MDDIGPTGYDLEHGWGRANARGALDYIGARQIFNHLTVPESDVVQNGPPTAWMTINWTNPPNGWPSGDYMVRRYEMRATPTFPVAFTSPPDVWVRLGGTVGLENLDPQFYNFSWGGSSNVTNTGCTLTTYVYEVQTGGVPPMDWWPAQPSEAKFAYTAAGFLAAASVGSEEQRDRPALQILGRQPITPREGVELALRSPREAAAEVVVYNAAGQRVATPLKGTLTGGETIVRWDARHRSGQHLESGVYYIRATIDGVGQWSARAVLVE